MRVRGDTTFVESRGPGEWGEPRVARVVQRINGPTSDTPFGRLDCVTSTADGGAAVFDSAPLGAASILLFDPNGDFRGGLGRQGSGPGEYGLMVFGDCLESLADGSLLHLDPSNGRINYFPASAPAGGKTFAGLMASGRPPYLTPGPAGTFFMSEELPGRKTEQPFGETGYVQVDTTGAIVRRIEDLPSLLTKPVVRENDPVAYSQPAPDGSILLFRTDRVGFLRTVPDSRSVIHVERVHEPVAVRDGEREDRRQLQRWYLELSPEAPPDPGLNDTKPAFYYAYTDLHGRVWLQMAARADSGAPSPRPGAVGVRNPPPPLHWVEPTIFNVFEVTGRYLGEVRFPVASHLWLGGFTEDGAWSIGTDSLGLPELIQWRF